MYLMSPKQKDCLCIHVFENYWNIQITKTLTSSVNVVLPAFKGTLLQPIIVQLNCEIRH